MTSKDTKCECCGGRCDNCGQPDYCCAGCNKLPRPKATEATLVERLNEIRKREYHANPVPHLHGRASCCALASDIAHLLDEIERLRARLVVTDEKVNLALHYLNCLDGEPDGSSCEGGCRWNERDFNRMRAALEAALKP